MSSSLGDSSSLPKVSQFNSASHDNALQIDQTVRSALYSLLSPLSKHTSLTHSPNMYLFVYENDYTPATCQGISRHEEMG